jgi:hypothetical protein
MEIGHNKAAPKNLQSTDFQPQQRSIPSDPLLGQMILDVENARSPLQAGAALRALDGVTGGRATTNLLFENDNLPSSQNYIIRIDNHATGTVNTAPNTPIPGTITDGVGLQGFPEPPPLADGDGSGEHGAREATPADEALKAGLFGLALGAQARNLPFAADNLRHYLGNTGNTKEFDPAGMLDDVPAVTGGVRTAYSDQILKTAVREILRTYTGEPITFQITSEWNVTDYIGDFNDPKIQNWFYSIGQASYNFVSTVSVSQNQNDQTVVGIHTNLNMFDVYNWDAGKGVEIGGFTVTDEQMGSLHEAGIAKEYELRGTTEWADDKFLLTEEGMLSYQPLLNYEP